MTTRLYISILLLFFFVKGYSQLDTIILKPVILKEIPPPVTMFNETRTPSRTIPISSWVTADFAEKADLEDGISLYYYGQYKLSFRDKRLAKKYKIEYKTMVCLWVPGDNPKRYNVVILRKLEEKYGS